MNSNKTELLKKARSFDEILEIKYGKRGTEERETFHQKARDFAISEQLKDARKQAKITQQQLAEKIGTKKTYISRIENGRSDIQLSTLYKIFEKGLGKKVNILIS